MNTAPIWGPILAIILAALWNQFSLSGFRKEMKDELAVFRVEFEKRFQKIDKQFDKIDERFDKIDKRFDAVDAELRYFHGSFGTITGRVDELSKQVNKS